MCGEDGERRRKKSDGVCRGGEGGGRSIQQGDGLNRKRRRRK